MKLRIFMVLVASLVWCQPTWADDGEDQLAYERAVHTLSLDVGKGQIALRKFLKQYPQSSFCKSAYLRLYASHDHSKAQREAALRVLAELQESQGTLVAGREIWKRLGDDYGFKPFRVEGIRRENFLTLTLSAFAGPDSSFKLYKISDKEYFSKLKAAVIEDPQDFNYSPSPESFKKRKLIKEFEIEKWGRPTKTGNSWNTRSYDGDWILPKTLSGTYVVQEKLGAFIYERIVVIPHFGLALKPLGKNVLAFAVDPVSGQGVSGVTLSCFAGDKKVAEKSTDSNGVAIFKKQEQGVILAEKGDTVCLCNFETRTKKSAELVYISTDRPIYRPGQTIYFKGIHRKIQESSLSFKGNDSVKVEIRDPNEKIIKSYTKTWSDFGTLSDEFTLANEPAIGTYTITVHVPRTFDHYSGMLDFDDEPELWTKDFDVRAYRKPYGKVTITMEKAATLTTKAQARIHAEYFHGGPVRNAAVNWSVSKRYLWNDDSNLNYRYLAPFNDPLAWLYNDGYPVDDFGWDDDDDPEEYAEDDGETDANGDLLIEFPMPPTRDAVEYIIEADVEDDSRLSVGTSKVIKLNESSVKLSVGAKTMFGVTGESITAVVKAQDAFNKPKANAKIQLTAFIAEDPFGKYGSEFESLKKVTVTTNSLGLAECQIPLSSSGRVRLRARCYDDHKRKVEARSELWSAGPNALDPTYDEPYLDIMPEKAVFTHGEKGRFLIRSNAFPLKLLLSIENSGLLDHKVITVTKPSQVISLAMHKRYGSNVDIKLQGWKNDRPYSAGFHVHLHSPENEINVNISTDKKEYGPGETATILVETLADGQAQSAELEFVIIDNKILEILPDSSLDLRSFFLNRPFRSSKIFSNLNLCDHFARLGDDELIDPNGGGGGGGGGGVLSFDDEESEDNGVGVGTEKLMELIERKRENAAFENAPAITRKWFPDTMIYKGHAVTNAQGKLVYKLKMPDSLTSWRILARAVTKTHQFGHGKSEVLTRKDILVRCVAPRFYTKGDTGTVSTIVYNNSGKAALFTVSLEGKGLTVQGKARLVKIGPKQQKRLDWQVLASTEGIAVLEAKALSPLGSDAIQKTLPVKTKGVKYTVSLSEFFKGSFKGELVLPKNAVSGSGSLEIYVGTGPGSAIKQALPYLARYPYGCVEQTMSRFLPAIVASSAIEKHGLNVGPLKSALPDMVEKGLQRLYGFQHSDGGWGWWKHDETHPFMTAYVVFGLLQARKAGYEVSDDVLKEAYEAFDDLDQTPFWHYVQSLKTQNGLSKDLQASFMNDTLSSKELAFLVLAGGHDLAKRLPKAPPKTMRYQDIVSTALVLKAYCSLSGKVPVDKKIIESFADWLLKARRGRAWVTTLDSAYAVFALCDLIKKGELGDLKVKVNGKSVDARHAERGFTVPAKFLKTGKNVIELSGAKDRLIVSSSLSYFSEKEQSVGGKRKLWIRRTLEKASIDEDGEKDWSIIPSGSTVKRGTELRMRVVLQATESIPYIMVEAPILAGCEALDEDSSDEYWDDYWYKRKELRDDRVSVASPEIDSDLSEFSVPLKLTAPGNYTIRPAEAYNMYDTAIRAVSKPLTIKVID